MELASSDLFILVAEFVEHQAELFQNMYVSVFLGLFLRLTDSRDEASTAI